MFVLNCQMKGDVIHKSVHSVMSNKVAGIGSAKNDDTLARIYQAKAILIALPVIV